MRFGLVTLHDHNYKQLADLTWDQNRLLYAQKHGYEPIAKTDGWCGIPIGFEKIKLLLEIMDRKEHDALFWTGTDTMITNWHIPLDEFIYPGQHIVMANDFGGLNSDSFLVMCTPEGRGWLQMIMDRMPNHLHRHDYEQGIMQETLPQYSNIFKVLPQRYMNSYWYPLYYNKGARNHMDTSGYNGHWRPGDFLLHSPDQTMDVRLDLFRQAANMVLK